jgi:hypothetical protein
MGRCQQAEVYGLSNAIYRGKTKNFKKFITLLFSQLTNFNIDSA